MRAKSSKASRRETALAHKRKDGREHVAIVASWSFLTLIFHPMRFYSDIRAVKVLSAPTRAFYGVHNTFLPGWRRLVQLERSYLSHVVGLELEQTTEVAILVAALANNITEDDYSWLESALPVIRDFRNEHIGFILEFLEHRAPFGTDSTPFCISLKATEAGWVRGNLQKELMRRIWSLWGAQNDFRGNIDKETEALLASLVDNSFHSS